MKNISFTNIVKTIRTILSKFQMTLFVVLLAAGLGFCVLTINNILASSSVATDGYTSSLVTGTIDTTIVTQLQALKTSNDPTIDLSLPSGRINPFTE